MLPCFLGLSNDPSFLTDAFKVLLSQVRVWLPLGPYYLLKVNLLALGLAACMTFNLQQKLYNVKAFYP